MNLKAVGGWLGRWLFTIAGLAIVVAVGYVFSVEILLGQTGNDTANALTFANWLDRYFPDRPFWFPLQGVGTSFTSGYNTLALLAAVGWKRWFQTDIISAYNLLLFFSPILTSLGIYFFVATRFKDRIMAWLAALLALLMPLSYAFITEWGFFNESVSYFFIPLTLAFFDRYLEYRRFKDLGLAAAFFALGTICHIATMSLLVVLVGVYGPVVAGIKRGAAAVLKLGVLVLLLTAFWLIPFNEFNRYAGRGMEIGLISREQIAGLVVPLRSMLGLERIGQADFQYALRNVQVPVVIWVLAATGIVLGLFKSKRILAFGLIIILWSLYAFNIDLWAWVASRVAISSTFLSIRSLFIGARILIPVLAAYGLAGGVKLLFKNRLPLVSRGITILLAVILLVKFAAFPRLPDRIINYGYDWAGEDGAKFYRLFNRLDLAKIFDREYMAEFLGRSTISDGLKNQFNQVDYFTGQLPASDNLRVDISLNQGGLVEAVNFIQPQLSQISLYTFTLFLNQPLWGWQQAAFYGQNDSIASADLVNNLAAYYGIKYVAINQAIDSADRFDRSGWNLVGANQTLQVWRNPGGLPLAELSSRPRVLVISSHPRARGYETIFKLATRGGLNYPDAWLVYGGKKVDDYSLEELRQFAAVILFGYEYDNQNKAWKLIEDYVRGGGSLFVDTGWQYTVPDWELTAAPAALPFTASSWMNLNPNSPYRIINDWSGDIDAGRLASLSWEEDKSWGVATFEAGDLRDWGETVLAAAGRPLIVRGRLGQGRLVWSGMNLAVHALEKDNQEEIRLAAKLTGWLLEGKQGKNYAVSVNRPHPDKVEFRVDEIVDGPAGLLWKESFHPFWQAGLNGKKLKVWEAGPSLTMIELPVGVPAGSAVTLTVKQPLRYLVFRWVSLITLAGVAALAVYPHWQGRLIARWSGLIKKIKTGWEAEE